jgi:hypothetical protein
LHGGRRARPPGGLPAGDEPARTMDHTLASEVYDYVI